MPVPDHIDRAAKLFRHNPRVLVAPPWPDIFVQDAERKQTPEEAQLTFHVVSAAYETYGDELVALPLASVAERVAFVLAHIAHGKKS